jgi:hypothetical protein
MALWQEWDKQDFNMFGKSFHIINFKAIDLLWKL